VLTTHLVHVHRGINGTVLRNHDSVTRAAAGGGTVTRQAALQYHSRLPVESDDSDHAAVMQCQMHTGKSVFKSQSLVTGRPH